MLVLLDALLRPLFETLQYKNRIGLAPNFFSFFFSRFSAEFQLD